MPVWLLKYLPHLVAAAALAFGAYWLHHTGYRDGLAAGEVRLESVLARQAQDAARARQRAVEAIQAEGAIALASAEKARLRASQAALAYKRRLEAALTGSPDCQEWAGRPVLCPLPGAP